MSELEKTSTVVAPSFLLDDSTLSYSRFLSQSFLTPSTSRTSSTTPSTFPTRFFTIHLAASVEKCAVHTQDRTVILSEGDGEIGFGK